MTDNREDVQTSEENAVEEENQSSVISTPKTLAQPQPIFVEVPKKKSAVWKHFGYYKKNRGGSGEAR